MKQSRKYFAIIHGCVLFICITIFSLLDLKAQELNALHNGAQLRFDHVRVGTTECLPITATNTDSTAVTISSLSFAVGTESFTLQDTITLPIILPVGKSMMLGKVCFTATSPNKEFVAYLKTDFSPMHHSDDGVIRIDATTEVDSSLLLPCLSVTLDSALFGPVFYGGQSIRSLNITNNLDTTRTIRCIDFTIGDRNAFSGIDNQFPLEIPPHQTRQIHIVFSPLFPNADSSGHFRSDVKIEPMSKDDACAPDFVLYGIAIKATDINTINPFSREPIHPALKMSGTDETFGQTFLFQCLDKDSLRINAITLENPDPSFVLSPMGACSSLPMVVLPGDYMAVRITLKTDDPSIHYNRLHFVLGNGQAPVVFDVEAMRIMQQRALTPLSGKNSIRFSIVPNPMSGSTTFALSGGSHTNITIFDGLGKVIDSRSDILTWRWDGKGAEGKSSPSGHYFIRATGLGPNGKSVVITRQLAIER